METVLAVEKALTQINRINSTVSEDKLEDSFAKCLSEVFDIERVSIKTDIKSGSGNLIEYVLNTRRPFVDNQLSEYSSFPELIGYWRNGRQSCAIIPIVVGGRSVSAIEMLSSRDGIFTETVVNNISAIAYVIGLSLLYKKEEARSMKLALYFDSAFNSPIPQLLLSDDGTIIKPNTWAMREFGISEQQQIRLDALFNIDIKKLNDKSKIGREELSRSKVANKVYALHLSKAGPNINYLHIRDATETERLTSIIDSMGPDYGSGVIILDGDFTIKYATSSLKKIIGYESTLAISRNISDMIPERERGSFKEITNKLVKSGKANGTLNMITDRGTISPVRFNITKMHDEYMLLFYDTSAETYVTSIGKAFNEFLEGSSEIAFKVDELGYITYCNHATEAILGYTRNELIGKEIRSIYSDSSILERDMSYARNGGKVDNSYISLIAKDENKKIESTNSMRFFKTANTSEYVIVAKELETKRKLKDQEDIINKQENEIKKLKAMGDQKSQFIYNISHELKTPLTNIRGYSKLMSIGEFGSLNIDQLSHVSTIIDESERLIKIIDQVLDAAKLESEKVKLELIDVNLKELDGSPSIKALEASAKAKGITFSWRTQFDVPDVLADHGRLIQVFVNLIGNSIKFTDKGGSIHVEISRKGRKYVECSVTDTGIGISEENRHKLFKKFYDAEKQKGHVKQEGSGTGLGLSITREIVRLHGGEIRYEPREGNGSIFKFTIPIKGKRKKKEK